MVTLVKVSYHDWAPDGTRPGQGDLGEFAVLDVRIVGLTAKPFRYDVTRFAFEYPQVEDPYNVAKSHVNVWNPDPPEYDLFGARLADGSVVRGRTAQGLVVFGVSKHGSVLFEMDDQDGVTPLAQWLTKAP